MSAYSVKHTLAAAASKPHTVLNGSASVIIELTDIIVHSNAAPADVMFELDIFRTTAIGTGGSALAEEKLKGIGPAATAAAIGGTFSGDPTNAGTSLQLLPFNQRAGIRIPLQAGFEIRSLAASDNGLSLYMSSVGAAAALQSNLKWRE